MIIQAVALSFKLESLLAIHDFSADTFKIALYNADTASLDQSTTSYSAAGEIAGAGYAGGGLALTQMPGFPTIIGSSAGVRFQDAVWSGASFSADGALIYNATKGNRAVMVLGFPTRQSAVSGVFRVRFPLVLPPIVQIT